MFNLSFNDFAAIANTGERLSYEELGRNAESIAEFVPSRALVFCLCENSIGSLAGYVALINNKSVPLLLDSSLDKELLANLINTYKPAFLYVPQKTAGDFPYKTIKEIHGYSLLKTEFDAVYPLHEELALLLTTSGSTGSPKLVRQSYKNIMSNAASICEYLEITKKERPITTLPMSYTYGLSIINSHLLKGATILLTTNSLLQKEFWEFFKNEKATSFGGVPYTYEILKKLRFFKMDLPSLSTMTQAGGKLPPELHREFAEYAINTNRRFFVMYGQTEATARMSYLPHEKTPEKYGSMGIAIPGGKFSLIDVDGSEITEHSVTGELVYRGDNVTLGYAECGEDLKIGNERNGVLITGDMAKRDEDGYYYIVGRKKRFLKLFGNRINLDEVEQMLKKEFHHLDCACGGVDDKLTAYVTDENEMPNIKKFISEKTGIHHNAFEVKYIEAIPKNESGKTIYAKLT